MNDPEHMAMLDRIKEQGDPGPPPLPPLATWSAEVDMGATINDSIQQLIDTIVRTNVGKDKQKSVPPIKWTPRPGRQDAESTSKSKLSAEERKARHARAVALFKPPRDD